MHLTILFTLHSTEEKKMNCHYRNTISLLLCLFITYASSQSVIQQITNDFNTNPQHEEGAEPNPNVEEEMHYLQKHQEISSRDYKLSSSNTLKGLRERPPSTYSLKMEAFHRVLNSTEHYETRPFSAGGYNWTLRVYPNGNNKDGGSGYLSLYVAIDKSSLDASAHQEVYADLRFYNFNRNQRKYFTIQDTDVFRFNAFKTMGGFSQVLPLDTFKDLKNGYLYDGDHSEFGVDVTVPKPFEKSELLSFSKRSDRFTWTIRGFSTVTQYTYSDVISFAGRKWQLGINPSGSGSGSGKAVSLFFHLLANQRTGAYEAVYVLAKFQVLNQLKLGNIQMELENWYGITSFGWGFSEFVSFDDLRDSSKGFLVDDTLMVQVELEAISTTKYFPS
ncbi:uncharacterized protein LOC106385541 [Brassica napus]|uniref:uncharacterized protein LOC106385541 n=1 Tax=Brassica napus TaxID=3708 RepID=UPI0020796F4E|nr:uncharacterized protein LOC106385541 [Brassica napus]